MPLLLLELELLKVALISVQCSKPLFPQSAVLTRLANRCALMRVRRILCNSFKNHNVPHGAGSKCLRLSLLTEDARDQFFLVASVAHASCSHDLQVHGSDCIRV